MRIVGRVGKIDEKRANFAKICTNLKELGGFWGGHEFFLIQNQSLVGWVGIVGNWVANFRKLELGGGDTIRDRRVINGRRNALLFL